MAIRAPRALEDQSPARVDQVLQTGKHQIEPFSLMSSKDERKGRTAGSWGGTQVSPAWLGPVHFKPGCSGSGCRGWSLTPQLGEFLSWAGGRAPTSLTFRNGSSGESWHWAAGHPTMAPLTDPRGSRTKEACARPPPSSASQLPAARAPAEVCTENTLREMQGQGQGHTARVQSRPGQNPALPEHETPRAGVPSLLVATGLGPGAAWAGHTLHGAGPGPPA